MDDVPEDLFVLGREAQHRGDDAGRDELRVVGSPVHELVSDHLVEVFVAKGANLRFQGIDRSRGERRQDDATSDRVKGRIGRDRWRAADRRGDEVRRVFVVHHHHHAAREVLRVIGDRGHHLVRGGEPPAAVTIGVRDRAAFAQVLPDWVRVVHPLRIGVVPVGGEVVDRHLH